jgi:hypothetical protein
VRRLSALWGLPAAAGDSQFICFDADWSPALLAAALASPVAAGPARRRADQEQALVMSALSSRFLAPGAPVLLWVYVGAMVVILASLALLSR